MPFIRVYGFSPNTYEAQLDLLQKDLKKSLEKDAFLIRAGSVRVLFPNDFIHDPTLVRQRDEVVAIVQLLEKDGRMDEIIGEIAHVTAEALKKVFPNSHIECFINIVKRKHFYFIKAEEKCQ